MQTNVEVIPAKSDEFLCVATYLPVRSWLNVVPFLLTSRKVLKQLGSEEGVVKYAVKADFRRKSFWTFSIWSNKEVLHKFVRADPHATAVKRFSSWAGEGAAFVEWRSTDASINWDQAKKRLKNPTFYYKTSQTK